MKYLISFILLQITIIQPIVGQLVERKCGCFDVPILPTQELISPINDIGYGYQRGNIFGNKYANIMPVNREINFVENLPLNNLYMPKRMVVPRSLSTLNNQMPVHRYNRIPNYVNEIRRKENIMNLRARLAELAGLAMTSANLLTNLPNYSNNNLIAKNSINSLPIQDMGFGNLGIKPIGYQNNIVSRLF